MNTENNKLIASFMGITELNVNWMGDVVGIQNGNIIGPLIYHSDWNFLMSVVEKLKA